MIGTLTILALGFVLGMRHATDADHVVAVTTILSRERSVPRAAAVGVFWGLGHTLTLTAAGAAIVGFGWVVPRKLGLGFEFTVGLMLVALGAWSLRAVSTRTQRHGWDAGRQNHARAGAARALVVGIVHGLAGSAAIGLLVLPALHERAWALAYLLVFGLGTIAGMALVTATLALPFTWSGPRAGRLHGRLGRIAGAASVGLGLFLVYDIGVVQGLLVR